MTALFPLGGDPAAPRTLVVGPSIGTRVTTLWSAVAGLLPDDLRVLGWDLPGHGDARAADGAVTVETLTADLARALEPEGCVHVAGDSLGGAVSLRLALDRPDLVRGVIACCTRTRFGTSESWRERAAAVRADGTASLLDATRQRWFSPATADRAPKVVEALLADLVATDDESYAQLCEALAQFDLTDELAAVTVPVLAVAGADDPVCPPDSLAAIAAQVPDGLFAVIPDAGHQVPAEQPERLARLVSRHLGPADPYSAGMAVRRAVLGTGHVDRAAAGTIAAPFQSLITRYAWGEIWTRPGLARRDRSLITLTALVAGGHLEELALHLRAARRNGLSDDEIVETLLQTAIYCGVPAANSAFRVAEQVLAEPRPTD